MESSKNSDNESNSSEDGRNLTAEAWKSTTSSSSRQTAAPTELVRRGYPDSLPPQSKDHVDGKRMIEERRNLERFEQEDKWSNQPSTPTGQSGL